MICLFFVGILCTLYEFMMGAIGVYLVDYFTIDNLNFVLNCKTSLRGYTTVWDPVSGLADFYVTLHTVVIIMWSMIHYIVFFIIPYKFNRIKKTKRELENILKVKLKKHSKKV